MSDELQKAIFGSADKMLQIGDVFVECYVLEDGTRVLSGRGMQGAIGLDSNAKSHGGKFKEILNQKRLLPFVSNELAMAINNPIRFIRPGRGGLPATAYEATLLIDACDAILDYRNFSWKKGIKLPKTFEQISYQCEVVTRAFARAGLISAIDEVTGYQEARESDAIQKIVNKFVQDYARKWSKTFPEEFWKKLIRVKGYPSYMALKRPQFVGHWVNDIVYSRIAPGIVTKLREINPRSEAGNRKHKHHQLLTADHGLPELREHLSKVMVLMDAASNKREFDRLLNRSLPKYGDTLELDLGDPNQ